MIRAGLAAVGSVAALAVGAAALPSGSVGTRQLRDRAVTAAKIAPLPAARLETSTMELPNNSILDVAFDRRAFDTARMRVSGGTGLRAPRAGIYAVDAGFRFPGDVRGARAIFITVTDQGFVANEEDSATADAARSRIMAVSTLVRLRRGDVVHLQVFQESGQTMRIPADTRSFLAMHYVSPAARAAG